VALSISAAAAAANEAVELEEEEIPPEHLALIAAAATAFLGPNLRMRSVELLPSPHAQVSRWTRQGRTFVQASHNVRSKR